MAGGACQPEQEYILKPGEKLSEKIKKNIFVRVEADKTSCYIGEPLVVTYKLYSRLKSESKVTKRPSLNGFSVYDMMESCQRCTDCGDGPWQNICRACYPQVPGNPLAARNDCPGPRGSGQQGLFCETVSSQQKKDESAG